MQDIIHAHRERQGAKGRGWLPKGRRGEGRCVWGRVKAIRLPAGCGSAGDPVPWGLRSIAGWCGSFKAWGTRTEGSEPAVPAFNEGCATGIGWDLSWW